MFINSPCVDRILHPIGLLLLIACAAHAGPALRTTTPERSRLLWLDTDRLARGAVPGQHWRFAPFDGVHLELIVDAVRPGNVSDVLISGQVIDEAGSWFRLVLHGPVAAGDFFSPGAGFFELRFAGSARHRIRQVDRSRRETCAGHPPATTRAPAPPPLTPIGPGIALASPPTTRITIIDLMVVYTPSARSMAGGVQAIEATIDLYVDYTNAVYAASGIHQRLRLVHATEVPYTESGNSITDLVRLKEKSDGFMDGVHALRDTHAADCVTLIATSGSAGVGYLMDNVSPGFEDRAFSAIGHDVGGIVLAHELGHNMGCGHNNSAGAPPAAFCYSYGHRTPGDAWRTIMSNAPGQYVDFFSSPNLSFMGFPLGVDGAGCPNDGADNVMTLNLTARVVAGFR